MRVMPVLAGCLVLAACARQTAELPAPHTPFLAAAPAPSAPLAPPPDPDLDPGEGALAVDDRCPDEPGESAWTAGCSDDDLVFAGDRCPGAAETFNDFEDDDGCPDADPPHVARLFALAGEVRFTSARRNMARAAHIDERGARALREAAEILHAHPKLAVRIIGHADARDDPSFARVSVSSRRAESVRRFLVAQGIDTARLDTVAMGPEQPIDSNRTAAGRARNRRVNFAMIPQPAAPVADLLQ
jgi:hypothetical protein